MPEISRFTWPGDSAMTDTVTVEIQVEAEAAITAGLSIRRWVVVIDQDDRIVTD